MVSFTKTASPFTPRLAVRQAILAAQEVCWLYGLALLLGNALRAVHNVSALSLLLMHLAGTVAGQLLPRSRRGWSLLQTLAVALAFLLVLVVVGWDFYAGLPLTTWLPLYLQRLAGLAGGVSGEHLATLLLLVAFGRGLGMGQRLLTVWYVSFQFRVGVVIFFFLALGSFFIARTRFDTWLYLYFIFALLGIALARIDESGRELALGPRWVATLGGAVLLVVSFGQAVGYLFQTVVQGAVLSLLALIAPVFEFILLLLTLPFFWLVEQIFRLLEPVLLSLARLLADLKLGTPAPPPQQQDQLNQVFASLPWLGPLLRALFVLGALALAGFLIARQLNRRLAAYEADHFAVEPAGPADRLAREDLRPRRRRAAPLGDTNAENIRRIYASFLKQAAARGLARRAAETPLEFLPRAVARWPAADGDLHSLTEAYVAVHYAEQTAAPAQVLAARQAWDRARGHLLRENGAAA